MSLWLDYLLDDMKGATARYLRRDRFETWCDAHERHLGHCLFGCKSGTRMVGGAASVLGPDLARIIQAAFNERYYTHLHIFTRMRASCLAVDVSLEQLWRERYNQGIKRCSAQRRAGIPSPGILTDPRLTVSIVSFHRPLLTRSLPSSTSVCLPCQWASSTCRQ